MNLANSEMYNEILSERGIISTKRSESNKKISKFEENFENTNKLFAEINNMPFLRFLLQAISKKGEFITFDELHQYIRKSVDKELHARTLADSPFKKIMCKNCNNPIYSVEYDKVGSMPPTIKCQNCKSPNYRDSFIVVDDWDIGVNELEHCIDKLRQLRVIHEGYQTYCTNCIEVKPLTPLDVGAVSKLNKQALIEYVKSFYCNRCKKLGTTQKVCSFRDDLFQLWGGGGWLEWYVYRILTTSKIKFSYIKQGVIVQKENKEEVEVDTLFVLDNKIGSIECKDIKIDKSAEKNDVDSILKLIDFSDIIVFVTTTEIKSRTKKDLDSVSENLEKQILFIFIEGKNIEHFSEILLQKIEEFDWTVGGCEND